MSPRGSKKFPRNNREIDEKLPGQEPEEDSDDIVDSTDGGSGNSSGSGNGSGNSSNGEEVSNEGNGDEPEPEPEPEPVGRVRRGQSRRLRREYRTLLRARSREERLLAQETALRDRLAREIEVMERRNQMLRSQRTADLIELRALETESSDDEDQKGAGSPTIGNKHTLTGKNEASADETAGDDEEGKR